MSCSWFSQPLDRAFKVASRNPTVPCFRASLNVPVLCVRSRQENISRADLGHANTWKQISDRRLRRALSQKCRNVSEKAVACWTNWPFMTRAINSNAKHFYLASRDSPKFACPGPPLQNNAIICALASYLPCPLIKVLVHAL